MGLLCGDDYFNVRGHIAAAAAAMMPAHSCSVNRQTGNGLG
jgi:hypothetical protein